MKHRFSTEIKKDQKQWQVFSVEQANTVLICIRDLETTDEWEVCYFTERGELVRSYGIPESSGLQLDDEGRIKIVDEA